MRPIFTDPELQQRFDRDGFVVVRLLSPDEVKVVRRRAEAVYEGRDVAADAESPKQDYHVSILHPDADYRRRAFELVREALAERIDRVVPGYRLLVGTLLIKPAGTDTLAVHRDWNMTTDPTDTNLNCWCALERVDSGNGAMGLIPGSHRILEENTEGPCISSFFLEYEQHLRRPSQVVSVDAGEAVIFDYRMLHWSCSNPTDVPRFALSAGCVPATAQPALHVAGRDACSLYRIEARPENWVDLMIEAARGLDVAGAPCVENRNGAMAQGEVERLLGLEPPKRTPLTRARSFAGRVKRGVGRRIIRR
jgi:ectoine hydroxylase-related dioxygenase (phytanoyl-CoA dioxygenase family)